MFRDTPTGVPNPDSDRQGHWFVPPWEPGLSFSAVVRHFLRSLPRLDAGTANLTAYYEGFRAVLDATPNEESPYTADRDWQESMRRCVDRCARIYREMHAAETGRVSRKPPAIRHAA